MWQELWCTCDSAKTQNSAEVKKGCKAAAASKKFGTCSKPVTCPGHKDVGLQNAKSVALRYISDMCEAAYLCML